MIDALCTNHRFRVPCEDLTWKMSSNEFRGIVFFFFWNGNSKGRPMSSFDTHEQLLLTAYFHHFPRGSPVPSAPSTGAKRRRPWSPLRWGSPRDHRRSNDQQYKLTLDHSKLRCARHFRIALEGWGALTTWKFGNLSSKISAFVQRNVTASSMQNCL